jgi:RTX calcium-binding nonapeptide repeat (4 copies)
VLGGTGTDSLAGGQASDLVDGGPGDDTLVGDVPNPETFLPPIPDPNPRNALICRWRAQIRL